MAIKVLVNAIGQHLIADVKQVENTETKEVLAYWVREPRLVTYDRGEEEGDIRVRFSSYCVQSDENEFSIRAENIVSILEPKDDVAESYREAAYPPVPEVTAEVSAEETDESVTDPAVDGPHPDLAD